MPSPKRERTGGALELLAPIGTLVALALPYFVLVLASAEATRDAKLAAQSAGALLVLLGLAFGSHPPDARATWSPAARMTGVTLGAALALFFASFVTGLLHDGDPLDAIPLIPALTLLAWGATAGGGATARRALSLLVGCGAVTGLLATLQRFAGVLRLPVEAPEPRFYATAWIGNPGDVGAALVLPALLAASSLARGKRRLASGTALIACVAGLASAGTLAPLVAFASGAALLVALDFRRRLLPAVVAGAAAVAILAGAGVVRRAAEKLASGDIAKLTTQRDIGVLAALETIREHPLLGAGPGSFASDFVRARLAAEQRTGRRLVHLSASAHFDNAHCDPLTVAAEAGVPAALALAAALGALLAGLFGAARREGQGPTGDRVPAETLLPALAAILVLSLASFPIQIVPVSGPFALLAGLSLARIGGRLPTPARSAAKAGVVLVALLLAAGATMRLGGGLALAHAESAMRVVPATVGAERAELAASALADARRAVGLRPRLATAHLALGSARAALADVGGAVLEMKRSLALEERAETLLNLGRLALAEGDDVTARACFVRAVWLFPRLAAAIPPLGDPDAVVAETTRLEAALASGGVPPPLPARFRSR
ncbi:MAG TPA: O-antigen ligase family protein [Thermoanaerobaculia bacterium]|nr:O-antigen ligase family protein [Thermoanaerobaculia bacterium]